ncbi:MAG: glycerol-3-phosphate 1-O-acyltransferase PlsY [Rubricoccaceae bacterium]|nr:glycerol-3-phosphate 1-O-acyltransferase PlsY [Rubricoccaceae bacterium]
MLSLVVILLLSYLLGSIPSALIAGRIRGVYLEQHGSGNAGATNALRVLGPKTGVAVLLADVLKGLLAVVLISPIRLGDGLPAWLGTEADAWVGVMAGLAALVGHVYTVVGRYFYGRWRGGKGVATAGGMLFGLVPFAAAVALALFAGVVALTRLVSLGSLAAAIAIPTTVYLEWAAGLDIAHPILIVTAAIPIIILYTHRSNVKRLLTGTERRIDQRASPEG